MGFSNCFNLQFYGAKLFFETEKKILKSQDLRKQ